MFAFMASPIQKENALMRKLGFIASLGCLFTAAAFAETMSGTISETMCGAKHHTGSAADVACVKKCVKAGSSPVLVSDGKVYQIAMDSQSKVMSLLGKNVTVMGTLNGDTIDIKSAKAAK
jgi:hypothetical protein